MPGQGVTVEQKRRYPDVVDTFGQPHYDTVLVDGRCGRAGTWQLVLPMFGSKPSLHSYLCLVEAVHACMPTCKCLPNILGRLSTGWHASGCRVACALKALPYLTGAASRSLKNPSVCLSPCKQVPGGLRPQGAALPHRRVCGAGA